MPSPAARRSCCTALSGSPLRAFRHTTPEQRPEWLEQAGRFVDDFVPPRKLEKWNKLTGNNR